MNFNTKLDIALEGIKGNGIDTCEECGTVLDDNSECPNSECVMHGNNGNPVPVVVEPDDQYVVVAWYFDEEFPNTAQIITAPFNNPDAAMLAIPHRDSSLAYKPITVRQAREFGIE